MNTQVRVWLSANRTLLALIMTAYVVVSCQGSEAPTRTDNNNSQNAGGMVPSPSTSPTPSPSPTVLASSCDEQWQQHVAKFKVGSKLDYGAYITSSSPLMTQRVVILHSEEVIASSDAEVNRKVTISSSDVFVKSLLTLLQLPQNILLKKENFIALCQKSSDNAANTVTFSGANLKVIETRDDTVLVNGQQTAARFVKLNGSIGTTVTADIQVWMSKDTSGLVLKQISLLSGVPLVSTATITDELTSSSN